MKTYESCMKSDESAMAITLFENNYVNHIIMILPKLL